MTDVAMVPTLMNGRWLLSLPEHRAVRPEWTTPPYWEAERIASMHANIRPGDVVVDVGAEEGDMSGLWASWVGPTGGVALAEPNPAVWPNIRAVWTANNLPAPLAWWVGFASDEDRPAPPDSPVDQTPVDGWPACAYGPVIGNHGFCVVSQRPDIPAVRLDDFLDAADLVPDVLTMDVEGAELHVLRGAERTLTEHHPLVYVSVHPQFMVDTFGQTDTELHAFMDSLGYRGRHLATDHEEHWVWFHQEGRPLVEASP